MKTDIKGIDDLREKKKGLKVGDIARFRFMDHVGVVLKCHWDGKYETYDFAVQYPETLDGIEVTDHLRLYNIPGKHILMTFEGR